MRAMRPRNRRRAVARLVHERLESRVCLSAVPATTQIEWLGRTADVRTDGWIVQADSKVAAAGLDLAAGWLAEDLGEGFHALTTPGAGVADVLGWAARTTGIRSVEPDFVLAPTLFSNDPSFSQLWGLHNTGQSGGIVDADIDAPEAWNTTTGSRNVVIAVIDTGVDYTHRDLAANAWRNPGEIAGDGVDNDGNGYVDDVYGWDFANNDSNPLDDQGHGTHVAGTIGAVGNDGTGVVGVNWQVSIMALKFLSASGSGSTSGAIGAINYATRMRRDFGVNIVATNNSWGGGGFSTSLRNAIDAGGQAGILFVAAAGNESTNVDVSPSYPAAYTSTSIISVAATDRSNRMASFSNYGATNVDIGAPGSSIYSTTPGNRYATYSGTSMATPHVAGVVGLLAAANPTATAAQIRSAILNSAVPIPALAGKVATGGLVNAAAALAQLGSEPPVDPPEPPPPPPPPPPAAGEPNDSLATAVAVSLASGQATVTGFVGNGAQGDADVDLYAFTAAAGARVVIDVDARVLGSGLDSYLRLFDASGRAVTQNDDANNSLDSLLEFSVPTSGTWYVGVSSYGNVAYDPAVAGTAVEGYTTGSYSLSFVTFVAPPTVDVVDVVPDPRTTAVETVALTFSRAVTGVDVADLRLELDGKQLALDGVAVASTDGVSWIVSGLESLTASAGSYVLRVVADGSGIVAVGDGAPLAVGAQDAWLVLPPTLPDVGNTLATSLVVPATVGAVRVAGTVGDGPYPTRDVDLFRVTLASRQRLVVDIDAVSLPGGSTLDSYVRIFDSRGRQVTANDDYDRVNDSWLSFTPRSEGTYYVGVSGYRNSAYSPTRAGSGRDGSTGVYQLALAFDPVPVGQRAANTIRMLGFAENEGTARRRQAVFAAFAAYSLAAVPSTPAAAARRR